MNYRNQWPAIDANFTTISAYADFYLEDKNSGIGAILTRDNVGIVGLQSISLAVQYAYQLQITKGLSFRPGVQVGIVNRSVNFGSLTFGDQFDPNTGDLVKGTAESLNTGQSVFFPDISFGGLLFSGVGRNNSAVGGHGERSTERWERRHRRGSHVFKLAGNRGTHPHKRQPQRGEEIRNRANGSNVGEYGNGTSAAEG